MFKSNFSKTYCITRYTRNKSGLQEVKKYKVDLIAINGKMICKIKLEIKIKLVAIKLVVIK